MVNISNTKSLNKKWFSFRTRNVWIKSGLKFEHEMFKSIAVWFSNSKKSKNCSFWQGVTSNSVATPACCRAGRLFGRRPWWCLGACESSWRTGRLHLLLFPATAYCRWAPWHKPWRATCLHLWSSLRCLPLSLLCASHPNWLVSFSYGGIECICRSIFHA